jgi:oxygen-dependent protoporphyrinogen oxidase
MATVRDVVVIGAGLAGMAAAHALKGRDVIVYEADERAGGRVFSQKRQPYWMSVGAHILGGPDTAMGRLATEFGLTLAPIPGDLFAMWTNGKLVRGGKPELAPFRLPLTLAGRMSLVRAGLRLRRAALKAAASMPDVIHGDRVFSGD